MTGVNGYFYAGIYSPNYFNPIDLLESNATEHSVIINKNFEIVHDPNPNYQEYLSNLENHKIYPLSKILDYNGILDIYMINEKML